MLLEDLLAEEGIASREALGAAADAASRDGVPLAGVLVSLGLVSGDVLADLVARAIGSIVVDVERGSLDTDAVRLLSEDAARRHLMIAVAKGTHTIRVAFANPLDEGALAAVRDLTGLDVEPMVATVSAVEAAIEKEYGKRHTVVLRGRSGEIPQEDTARVQVRSDSDAPLPPPPATDPVGTAPMHRLEQEATIEQRHEALLLALVDAGTLTRSDYIAALKRLEGRRER